MHVCRSYTNTKPFYMTELNSLGFQYLQGIRGPIFWKHQATTVLPLSSKLICFACSRKMDLGPLNSFPGQATVYCFVRRGRWLERCCRRRGFGVWVPVGFLGSSCCAHCVPNTGIFSSAQSRRQDLAAWAGTCPQDSVSGSCCDPHPTAPALKRPAASSPRAVLYGRSLQQGLGLSPWDGGTPYLCCSLTYVLTNPL